MQVRAIAVGSIRVVVILLLLLGTNRFCRGRTKLVRLILAALLGGLHSWACLQSGFSFLASPLWRTVALALSAGIAFGMSVHALQCSAVFALLMLAVEGITAGFGSVNPALLLMGGCCVCIICTFGFGGNRPSGDCVPVELNYGTNCVQVVALRDSGNMLTDPVTGSSVLVVDAAVAQQLTGLTRQQLCSPVEAITSQLLPGLRLIPYHSLGCSNGMMLALRLSRVRIGNWQGSTLVAFAPNTIGTKGTYQALTGGI